MQTNKVSFGFSKLSKKPNLLPVTNKKEEKQVELIKCLEGKEIKLVTEKQQDELLVIPIQQNTITSTALLSLMKRRAVLLGEEEVEEESNKAIETNGNNAESIEERAARELLAEAKGSEIDTTNSTKLVLGVPKPDELPLEGAKESTQDDYENIPVGQFGLAMLRGMGWVEPPKEKKTGIDEGPVLRPKGMGLGADKALKPKPLLIPPEPNEKLEIKKKAYVRILGGKHKDAYGQIEGFDDEYCRVIVKMAIGGNKETFNEFLCQPVGKKEYAEYGKCINNAKYTEYKRMENEYGQIIRKPTVKEEKFYVKREKSGRYYESEDSKSSSKYREKEHKYSRNDRDYDDKKYNKLEKEQKYKVKNEYSRDSKEDRSYYENRDSYKNRESHKSSYKYEKDYGHEKYKTEHKKKKSHRNHSP